MRDFGMAALVVGVAVFIWWDWRRDRERGFADSVVRWQHEYAGGPLGGPRERSL